VVGDFESPHDARLGASQTRLDQRLVPYRRLSLPELNVPGQENSTIPRDTTSQPINFALRHSWWRDLRDRTMLQRALHSPNNGSRIERRYDLVARFSATANMSAFGQRAVGSPWSNGMPRNSLLSSSEQESCFIETAHHRSEHFQRNAALLVRTSMPRAALSG